MSGFTLIELMVAIAVLAVLATLAMPGFSLFIADQKVRIAIADLHADLKLARTDAIANQRRVFMILNAPTDWKQGWLICGDAACSDILHRSAGFSGRIAVCTNIGDFAAGTIIFRPDGRIERSSTPVADERITISDTMNDTDASNDRIRSIYFGPSGRMHTIIQNGWSEGGQPC